MTESRADLRDIAKAYTEVTRIARDLRPDDSFVKDLGVDSVAAIELMGVLEDRFGVSLIDNPRIFTADTVQQLLDLINDLRSAVQHDE
ncbi:acyl carrier protein [Nocardia sp. CDC160]|uniref:acyl carrier protein n=1 Tax=Nocardia sp. CDC160 TaxID=3112166 RepID=UPI002DBA6F82|nr:acyl carrier protein [Nocardia sp. CDC160]MEC3919184.1 acyl carrier protein [Nocardia sp. CDC160]